VKTAVCIPTLNAGSQAAVLADAIAAQTLQADMILVVDSSSDDGSVETFKRIGARIHSIDRRDFSHGGTRQLGVELLADADLIIFLTQDAIPGSFAFEKLSRCFDDPQVAAAFGRQLPRPGSGPIEAHARLFNYSGLSRVTTLDDRQTLGIKTVFFSNSFSAYRRIDLMEVGGFPSHLIMGEDTYVAAKMLLAGKKIAYSADAAVIHSHDYSLREEFRRYFDAGVLHSRERWIRDQFGGAENEGLRFVKSEVGYLLECRPILVPSALFRTLLKFLGFQLGLRERVLPLALKRRLGMLRTYWTVPGKATGQRSAD
jgi:rhamnosyltransferase